MSEGAVENIFQTSERLVEKVPVFSSYSVFLKENDYERSTPTEPESLEVLREIFQATKEDIIDPKSLLGNKTIKDKKREKLQLPEVSIIKGKNSEFIELSFNDDLKIVVENQLHSTVMNFGSAIKGYRIKHALISGQDGKVIDLIKISQNPAIQNIFSFSGRTPGFSPQRQYKDGGRIYPSEVLTIMPTQTEDQKTGWNPKEYKFLFLHENSHGNLSEKDIKRPGKVLEKERDANAIALASARRINRLYPESKFFHLATFQAWIHKQMQEGYSSWVEKRNQKKKK